ncbi:MAG: hypothetical protein K2Q20_14740, partial [Phycisphaerales bacterium]|nr:hypothetical protein [Phycisphaerales bacterium]
ATGRTAAGYERGRLEAARMAEQAFAVEQQRYETSRTLAPGGLTGYQQAILDAMARTPLAWLSPAKIATHMPDTKPPTKPSIRRLAAKGLLFTRRPSDADDRVYRLTRKGYLLATGIDDANLPDLPTHEQAQRAAIGVVPITPTIDASEWAVLVAMASSERKPWSIGEIESVLPLGFDMQDDDLPRLEDMRLITRWLDRAGERFCLTRNGHRVATGWDAPYLPDFGVKPFTGIDSTGPHHASIPPSRQTRPARSGKRRAKKAGGSGCGCLVLIAIALLMYACLRSTP